MAELPPGGPQNGHFWGPGALFGPPGGVPGPGRGSRGRVRGPGRGPGGLRGRVRGPGRGPEARLGPPEGPGGALEGPGGALEGPPRPRRGPGRGPDGVPGPPEGPARASGGLRWLQNGRFCWFSVKIITFGTFRQLKCAFSKATVCKIQKPGDAFPYGFSVVTFR